MKAFSYIRWSSDIQTKGDSLARQLEATRKICEANKWQLDETLKDEGMSAFTGSNLENGSFARFLKSVNNGEITTPCVLVVEQLDRLTRTSLHKARRLFEGLLEKDVKICTAHNGRIYDRQTLDDPFALIMSMMELKAAHDYSANLSRRVGAARQRAKEAAAKNKTIFTSSTFAWLIADRKNNSFKKVKRHVEVVRRIFSSYANGKGIRTIMRELNREKIPTFARGKQNKGNGWSSTHLRRTLGCRGVLGEYQPHKYISGKRIPDGAAIPDFYPPVVDKTTFYKVQEILKKHTHTSGCKRNATNLFTGLVICATCGGSLVIKRSGAHRGNPKWSYISLVCSNAMRGNGCKYHVIRYEWVERAVLTLLWTKIMPVISERDGSENKLLNLTGELKHIQDTLADYESKMFAGEAMPKTIQKVLNHLETTESELKLQIESLTARSQDNGLATWKHVEKTVENRLRLQSILSLEIESIAIDAGKLTGVLKLKHPDCEFDLAWTPKNKDGFNSIGKQFVYQDNIFVWKSSENLFAQWGNSSGTPMEEAA